MNISNNGDHVTNKDALKLRFKTDEIYIEHINSIWIDPKTKTLVYIAAFTEDNKIIVRNINEVGYIRIVNYNAFIEHFIYAKPEILNEMIDEAFTYKKEKAPEEEYTHEEKTYDKEGNKEVYPYEKEEQQYTLVRHNRWKNWNNRIKKDMKNRSKHSRIALYGRYKRGNIHK